MYKHIYKKFLDFARDDRGSVVVEAVMVLPVLAWWFAASLVYFDAFKARNVNLKAAYTISDMVSRELNSDAAGIDQNYINGLASAFEYFTSGHGTNASIRVTMVWCESDCDQENRVLNLDWSSGTNGKVELTQAELANYDDVIPIMPQNDRVVLVETFIDYDPAFNVGLTSKNFDNLIVTRLRFAPRLDWDYGTG